MDDHKPCVYLDEAGGLQQPGFFRHELFHEFLLIVGNVGLVDTSNPTLEHSKPFPIVKTKCMGTTCSNKYCITTHPGM